jgi:hypothetical protein
MHSLENRIQYLRELVSRVVENGEASFSYLIKTGLLLCSLLL